MPTDYTIQIEMEDVHGDWIVVRRLPRLTDERSCADLANRLADDNMIADGADWRVRVWLGHDADAEAEPLCEVGWNEYEP
ncbi:hypothetical protein [Sphaerisporangium sp. TRM90804]|uniref:hypothetical protein n=1 Tax=Sphaerisporangium sp. TRM90804 TaxID=3031113 RepID=UPI0024493BFB|nr:hypothetical protein [Sphaerisporangium sp. TRM90804]MDH2429264.1 hypothetical protein [Sphaerisporangium sp. TRM90804]